MQTTEKRNQPRWLLQGLTLVLVLGLLLTACAPATAPTGGESADTGAGADEVAVGGAGSCGDLTFGLSTDPPDLDPHSSVGTSALTVKTLVYRGLVGFHENGDISMEIAESYDQPDDTTYVFNIRENANFHDGTPVTAEDVQFSIERIMDPAIGADARNLLTVLDSVEVIDDKTVQFNLSQPTASFMNALALPDAAIVSKAWIEAGNDPKTDMMGNGPFKLVEREKDVRIVLERNPDFYKEGLPKQETITFIPYRDENLRVTALRAGDVDIIEYVPWKDFASISANPDLELETTVGPFMYLIFNPEREPFDNPMVRRAIGYAIDRQAILDAAFIGTGSQLFGLPIPENSWLYNEELANFWEYNPERAREMLAEAGYPDGFSARLLSTSTYDMHEQTAVVVKDSLEQIGIEVELVLPEWGARVEQGNQADYDFAVMGSGADIIDPDWLTGFFALDSVQYGRVPNWNNEEVRNLLEQGRSTIDQEERREFYNQFAQIALEEAPYVWLTWREQGYAYQDDIEGFQNIPFLTFYSGITLESTCDTQ